MRSEQSNPWWLNTATCTKAQSCRARHPPLGERSFSGRDRNRQSDDSMATLLLENKGATSSEKNTTLTRIPQKVRARHRVTPRHTGTVQPPFPQGHTVEEQLLQELRAQVSVSRALGLTLSPTLTGRGAGRRASTLSASVMGFLSTDAQESTPTNKGNETLANFESSSRQ